MSRRPKPAGVVFDCMVFLQVVASDESVAARAIDLMESGYPGVYERGDSS